MSFENRESLLAFACPEKLCFSWYCTSILGEKMKEKIETEKAPKAPMLSQAIVSNGFIFVSGQVHVTPEGVLVNGSIEEKVHQIMKNIGAILDAGGMGFDDIVKATIYITDMAMGKKINEVYITYFKEPFPAREMVCVKELPLWADIEISVIAHAK